MRILHTEWSDGWGGQERRIISEMRGMQDRGHTLWLATRAHARIREQAEIAGIQTLVFDFKRALDFGTILPLARTLRQLRIDVVSTHSGIDSWVGGLAAKRAGTPILLRTRHLDLPLRRSWTNFVHFLPDRIVTCGEAIRNHLIDDCGFPPQQLVSIPTGIDFDTFAPRRSRADVRAELGLREDDFIIFMASILRRFKRHEIALETLRRLMADYPNIHLVIAGDGPKRTSIERQALEQGLVPRLSLLGQRDDVADLMGASDMLLLTSNEAEGVPQAITQALGLGLPVVSTIVGSVEELIEHERTGLLAPAEQPDAIAAQIRRIIDDPVWADELGMRALVRIREHYSLHSMLDATERLCDALQAAKA
ncbi:glycosyltransferase family 4 protein [Acidihalobacter ferrooxydans]|uniref:Glycosyl transferase n=1 Tax=Acidihalobacter ferrooxydans TaxID=1765967 RepID=A0A1P8UIZ0_9GAMM|nr:glycosyltransferase family 4 protein [Acidihalobacter ferrooxydans]APZ43809.1 hypothetical protein BW247_12520 [Acidihalobacter ferrooxydans]